jgi:hypothetical protein
MKFSPSCYLFPCQSKYLLLPIMWDTKLHIHITDQPKFLHYASVRRHISNIYFKFLLQSFLKQQFSWLTKDVASEREHLQLYWISIHPASSNGTQTPGFGIH